MCLVWASVVFFDYVGFHFSYSPFFYVCVFFRMVLQETYELKDGTFVDIGTSTSYTAWATTNNITVNRSTTETTLTQTDTSSFGYMWQSFSTITDIIFEFDVYTTDRSYTLCSFRDGGTVVRAISGTTAGLTDNTWGHVKLTLKDGKVYVNDATTGTSISTWNRLYITLNNGMTIKYKNFVVYPI